MDNMALYNKFGSNENKGILWRLMTDNDMFAGIPAQKLELIKSGFETQIRQLQMRLTREDTLVELNKKVIREMVSFLAKHKSASPTLQNTETPRQLYNASDITEQRQKVFQTQLQSKQSEFETLIGKKTPDAIDFSDQTLDTPIGSEMDKMLLAAIAFRENQLNLVLETQQTPEKKSAPAAVDNASIAPIQLKIGDPLPLNDREIITAVTSKRKVNFQDTTNVIVPNVIVPNNNNDNFNNNETIMRMLEEVLYKQNQILAILLPNQ
jgi:hypothetical protein